MYKKLMKNLVIKKFSKSFAKLYWAYLKPEIDLYNLNIQRAKFPLIGNHVVFKGLVTVYHPENIIIHDNVQFGENCFLMGIGGIEIGEGTIISRNVCIHSGNHNFIDSALIPYTKDYIKEKIYIGEAVWIGQNVNILPGVTIGKGAIIGMGTTISKDVLPYEIVVGMGQRVIGHRDKEGFETALKNRDFYAKHY